MNCPTNTITVWAKVETSLCGAHTYKRDRKYSSAFIAFVAVGNQTLNTSIGDVVRLSKIWLFKVNKYLV